jgi:hypothetical protein
LHLFIALLGGDYPFSSYGACGRIGADIGTGK